MDVTLDVWPWVVTLGTLAGIWLAGRHDRRGWLLTAAAKAVLLVYALVTVQYGFVAEALAMGAIYLRNWHRWRDPPKGPCATGDDHHASDLRGHRPGDGRRA